MITHGRMALRIVNPMPPPRHADLGPKRKYELAGVKAGSGWRFTQNMLREGRLFI